MRSLLKVAAVAAVFVALDAATKLWVVCQLPEWHVVMLIRGQWWLALCLVHNRGGSFGIGHELKHSILIFPALLAGCSLFWILKKDKLGQPISWMETLGFGLLIGGIVPNFCERVLFGKVTDFIFCRFFDFCIFNLADIFSPLGLLVLGFYFLIWQRYRTVIVSRVPWLVRVPA